MKKPLKVASALLAASFLAGTVLPANLPEKNSLEEISLECNVGGYPETKKSYTPGEIRRIIHDAYRCTPSKPDYLSERFVREIIMKESTNDPKKIGKKGERGLMQIRLLAWREVEKERNYHEHVSDPMANTEVGINYLLWIDKKLEKNYDGWGKLTPKEKRKMVLSAYNAGISRFEKEEWQLEKMPRGTKNYVDNIIAKLEEIGDMLP